MFAPCYIELSKSALQQNLAFLKDWIGEDTRFCSVIKGNAYGHNVEEFVPMAEDCGINYFAAFSADEAKEAYHAIQNAETDLMIMGMIGNDELEWAVERDISFFIFELDRLQKAIKAARKTGKSARIHLLLETGMNRLGLASTRLEQAVKIIKENEKHLFIEGICTHFAGAESLSNYERIMKQIKNFKQYLKELNEQDIDAKYNHTASSAATLNYPETIMNMVRIGIAQYGYWPNRETYMQVLKNHSELDMEANDPLKRVMTWKSTVMSVKKVPKGKYVGYGTIYQTARDETIATVPIGYAHGFGRNLSNTGLVLINGRRAPVAGLVNMNLLTVDITDIPDVHKGDEVVIIGRQDDEVMSVNSFSGMINTLNYEVLVRIPDDIPRRVVE
ncbi:MAG TPA: alanine racemase [Balneolaceae bacterium]|nr:alanine racemase [Balneolaceae bacterium]